MDLYFAPLACSMATRIAIYEAGADARFIEVDTKAKRIIDGGDYRTVNPLGYVPAMCTDDGEILTENAAILQYVASRFPAADLAPDGGIERALNWSRATSLDFEEWPALKDYFSRMRRRPSIARALAEEGALFVKEQERNKAA
jgi:glutathione S-transferase